MYKWLKASIVLAVLLAGAGALHRFVFVRPGIEQAHQHGGRTAIEDCRIAARMVYDVHWAAACMAHAGQADPGLADGHAECELPDHKAAVVNKWLDDAEARCTTELRAGLQP